MRYFILLFLVSFNLFAYDSFSVMHDTGRDYVMDLEFTCLDNNCDYLKIESETYIVEKISQQNLLSNLKSHHFQKDLILSEPFPKDLQYDSALGPVGVLVGGMYVIAGSAHDAYEAMRNQNKDKEEIIDGLEDFLIEGGLEHENIYVGYKAFQNLNSWFKVIGSFKRSSANLSQLEIEQQIQQQQQQMMQYQAEQIQEEKHRRELERQVLSQEEQTK